SDRWRRAFSEALKLVAPQTLIIGACLIGDPRQRWVELHSTRLRFGKAGRVPHGIVPMRRPDAIEALRSFGPGEHVYVEGNAAGLAQPGERARRISQDIVGIDHRRRAPQ